MKPFLFSLLFCVLLSSEAAAQGLGSADIEGRVRAAGTRRAELAGLRIRVTKQSGSRQMSETFTRSDGAFTFRNLPAGDYLVETFETEIFQATATTVSVQPSPVPGPTTIPMLIELPVKSGGGAAGGGTASVAADVDVNVPKPAQKHYKAGIKAMEEKDSERAVTELRAAIEGFPDYYAARLALGLLLRSEKKYQEAAETFKQLSQLAPKRPEVHVEYGTVLLGLGKKEEAVRELTSALQLEEANWTAHFFMGMAVFDTDAAASEKHFLRALEINERKAARAHVAVARIAMSRNDSQTALKHLTAYLNLEPNAPDAETVRQYIERLRPKK